MAQMREKRAAMGRVPASDREAGGTTGERQVLKNFVDVFPGETRVT
jgi:hypothetical protein